MISWNACKKGSHLRLRCEVGPAELECDPGLARFCGGAFPTVRYLRIFSMRFGPMPLIARRSSTLLNGPYDLRIFRILSAVEGPIPGTCCNSDAVAVFRFTGCNGGFLLAANADAQDKRNRQREKRESVANRAVHRHGITMVPDVRISGNNTAG